MINGESDEGSDEEDFVNGSDVGMYTNNRYAMSNMHRGLAYIAKRNLRNYCRISNEREEVNSTSGCCRPNFRELEDDDEPMIKP